MEYVYIRTTTSSTFNFFFFNDTATTEIYTLSLHDALPISFIAAKRALGEGANGSTARAISWSANGIEKYTPTRSEEHTSELQSQSNLVCRLLLEKKKHTTQTRRPTLHRDRSLDLSIQLSHC